MTKARVKITDEERQARMQPFMAYWMDRLGLGGWDISWELVDTLPGEATLAIVTQQGSYTTAHVKFTRKGVDGIPTPYEIETVIIHELLHVLANPLSVFERDELGGAGRTAERLHAAVERVVDNISMILYNLRYNRIPEPVYSPSQKE